MFSRKNRPFNYSRLLFQFNRRGIVSVLIYTNNNIYTK